MKKLQATDIWPGAVYEGLRQDFRAKVIAHKKARRVEVGPFMTFIFEDRLTVKFQVQEILRAEKVTAPEHIAEEVEGFNTMLPEDGALSATLLIASASDAEAIQRLASLVGLRERVALQVGEHEIRAAFDPNRENDHKISAVQYLTFAFSEAARAAFLAGTAARLVVSHPNYTHALDLPGIVADSLRNDLRPEV
jgi:hypothetical protein